MKQIAVCMSVIGAAVARADFNYTDFTSTSGLTLNGTAAQAGSIIRLTPLGSGHAGNIWRSPQEGLTDGFVTRFRFRAFEGSGADGIAFAVQDSGTNAIGSGGHLNAMEDLPNAVGVNFQSFWNQINFFANGVVLASATFNGLHRDAPWDAEISYNGATHDWDVRLDNSSVLTTNFDVATMLGSGTGFVGLGSGTGGADDVHDVHSWSYTAVPEPSTLLILSPIALGLLKRRRARS